MLGGGSEAGSGSSAAGAGGAAAKAGGAGASEGAAAAAAAVGGGAAQASYAPQHPPGRIARHASLGSGGLPGAGAQLP